MFCSHCGEPILGASGFCDGCGARTDAVIGTDVQTRRAGLLQRIKNIVLAPAAEWRLIAAEPASPRGLYLGYVAPLAALGVVAALVGRILVASPADRLATVLLHAVLSYALCFLGVFCVALIVDRLAPNFSGRRDALAALKLTAYGFTPVWIASVFNLVPAFNVPTVLGAVCSMYAIYLGLPVLMRCPAAKAAGYAVVTALYAIATWALLATLVMYGTAGIDRMAGEVARRA